MAKRSVLVVEDEEPLRTALAALLQDAGFDVEATADGGEALRVLALAQFDVVVADLLMPEKDGLELIGEIRKHHPRLAIVAMSGGGHMSGKHYLEMARRLGAGATLAKPFNRQDLEKAIEAAIHAASARKS